MTDKKVLSLSLQIEFPQDVDLTSIPNRIFNIWDMSDYQECFADYTRVYMRNGYFPIKCDKFRWLFFLDSYQTYDKEEAKDLVLTDVFRQKWYKFKFMTIVFLDKDLKFHKRTIPASQLEYEEEKALFDELYKILDYNDDHVGKYIKHLDE